GRTGFVVPVGDPAAMAAAVVRAEARRPELGATAHDHVVARYSLDVVADHWFSLLRRRLPPGATPYRSARLDASIGRAVPDGVRA
ncbi:MAG: hypothetical protein ACK5PP_01130, partial [Acidimicrobiales bacterium]